MGPLMNPVLVLNKHWQAVQMMTMKKADRTPAEAGMHLIREPRKPHWTQLRRPMKNLPPSWEKFLGELYWNIELDEDEE